MREDSPPPGGESEHASPLTEKTAGVRPFRLLKVLHGLPELLLVVEKHRDFPLLRHFQVTGLEGLDDQVASSVEVPDSLRDGDAEVPSLLSLEEVLLAH